MSWNPKNATTAAHPFSGGMLSLSVTFSTHEMLNRTHVKQLYRNLRAIQLLRGRESEFPPTEELNALEVAYTGGCRESEFPPTEELNALEVAYTGGCRESEFPPTEELNALEVAHTGGCRESEFPPTEELRAIQF